MNRNFRKNWLKGHDHNLLQKSKIKETVEVSSYSLKGHDRNMFFCEENL